MLLQELSKKALCELFSSERERMLTMLEGCYSVMNYNYSALTSVMIPEEAELLGKLLDEMECELSESGRITNE